MTSLSNLFRSFGFLLFIFFLFPRAVFSQTLPEKPSPARLVNDFAKIYSSDQANLLEQKLTSYDDKTSTQIAVVTVTTLDGYPVDDYTIKLANKWGIGQKGKNNGLLILISKAEHKIFIASGYGMEGVLNDGKIGTIIRTQMIPYFKNDDYYGGTNAGIDAMIAAAAGEYVNDQQGLNQQGQQGDVRILYLTLIIIALAFVFIIRQDAKLKNISFLDALLIFLVSFSRSGSSSGSSGGGGSGGFGGGGFGGGGAGGSW